MKQSASGDGDDDMERRFQRGLAEDGAPSEAVRRAILEHAHRMAVLHAKSQPGQHVPALRLARRRRTIFGALAAAVFAGLLVVPLLRAPSVREQSQVALPPNPVASAMPAHVAPQLGEVERQEATGSAAGGAPRDSTTDAIKPKRTAAPTSISTASDAAAAPPAAPNRSSDRVATPSGNRGELLRGAAISGDLAAVQALLKFAPDVDARDGSGRTALMLAILNGHADVVDALLAYGADRNAADAGGVRPLQMARAEANERIVDSLLRAGAH